MKWKTSKSRNQPIRYANPISAAYMQFDHYNNEMFMANFSSAPNLAKNMHDMTIQTKNNYNQTDH